MSISKNLKRLRNRVGKSQQDVADILNVERNTYANWENATSDVKSEYIPILSQIFQVEIKELFEDNEKLTIYNNSTNSDQANGGQHGFIVNVSDKETEEKIINLFEKLMDFLKSDKN